MEPEKKAWSARQSTKIALKKRNGCLRWSYFVFLRCRRAVVVGGGRDAIKKKYTLREEVRSARQSTKIILKEQERGFVGCGTCLRSRQVVNVGGKKRK